MVRRFCSHIVQHIISYMKIKKKKLWTGSSYHVTSNCANFAKSKVFVVLFFVYFGPEGKN